MNTTLSMPSTISSAVSVASATQASGVAIQSNMQGRVGEAAGGVYGRAGPGRPVSSPHAPAPFPDGRHSRLACPAAAPADPLAHYPTWARELARRYFTKTINQFILHGNVRDLVAADVDARGGRARGRAYLPLRQFLSEDLFAGRDLVVFYDRSDGIHFMDAESRRDFARAVSGYDSLFGTDFAKRMPKDPPRVFALLDNYFRLRLADGKRVACVIDYAETVVPMSEAAQLLGRGPRRARHAPEVGPRPDAAPGRLHARPHRGEPQRPLAAVHPEPLQRRAGDHAAGPGPADAVHRVVPLRRRALGRGRPRALRGALGRAGPRARPEHGRAGLRPAPLHPRRRARERAPADVRDALGQEEGAHRGRGLRPARVRRVAVRARHGRGPRRGQGAPPRRGRGHQDGPAGRDADGLPRQRARRDGQDVPHHVLRGRDRHPDGDAQELPQPVAGRDRGQPREDPRRCCAP